MVNNLVVLRQDVWNWLSFHHNIVDVSQLICLLILRFWSLPTHILFGIVSIHLLLHGDHLVFKAVGLMNVVVLVFGCVCKPHLFF